MALATFLWVTPSDAPRVGARVGARFRTKITTAESGVEKRRICWPRPKHRLEMDWSRLENAATRASALYDFFLARKGMAEGFIVFDFNVLRSYTDVRVGIATAGQTVITLPSRNATGVTVKLSAVTKTGTFAATSGANGRDKFTLDAAATGGEIVTASFTGQRAYPARLDVDEITLEYLTNRLYGGLGIPMVEVFGEE